MKLLSDTAVLNKKNTINSDGYDLLNAMDAVVSANVKATVPTDIAVATPEGTYGRIADKNNSWSSRVWFLGTDHTERVR